MKKRVLIKEEKDVQLTYKKENTVLFANIKDLPHGDLIKEKDYDDGRHVEFYESLPGIRVRSYDEKLAKTVWTDVSGWSKHEGCRLEIVNLSNGDQIFTDDDPRAVYGIPLDTTAFIPERFTPSDALARKVAVPCLKGLRSTERESVWSYWDLTDNQLVQTVPEGHDYFELTFACGQALGIITGDGWWSHRENPSSLDKWLFLADRDGYNADALISWMSEALGVDKVTVIEMTKELYKNRFGNTKRFNIKSQKLPMILDFLNESFGGERGETHAGAGSKHLPKWFSMAPYEFCRGLLCGLVATDGSSNASKAKAKKKKQSITEFTTISFDLARDVRRLCWLLGIKATISFSKETTATNKAWQVYLSSVDCKENNIFVGLCNVDKLNKFNNTKVNMDDKFIKKSVLFPVVVSSSVVKWITSPDLKTREDWLQMYFPNVLRLCKDQKSFYSIIKQAEKKNVLPERAAFKLIKKAEEDAINLITYRKKVSEWIRELESGERTTIDQTMAEDLLYLSFFFTPFTRQLSRTRLINFVKWSKENDWNIGSVLNLLRSIWSSEVAFGNTLINDETFIRWSNLVNGDYSWAVVSEVIKTGEKETLYDITVPGYETFTSDTGVVLSNTMTYYVPVSDKAVKEAYKLMTPSANQLSARDFTALPEMQEELVSGAYLASHKKKTPPKAIFNTKAEAADAYRKGLIDVDDNIIIRELQK